MKQKSGLKRGALVFFVLFATIFFGMITMAAENRVYLLASPKVSYYMINSKYDKSQCVKGSMKILKGKKYATVKLVKKDGVLNCKMTPKKAGTIKFKYKYKLNKKTKTVTYNIKIVKYKGLLSVFKIGKTDLTSKFKNTFTNKISKSLSGKLSIKAIKGSKVVNFTVYDKKSDYENGTMNFKDYMDGDNITLKKGAFVIILCEGKDKGITGLDLEVK